MCRRFLQSFKSFLLDIDLFGSSNFLRYKNQSNYTTLSGGVLTFFLIIAFAAIFINSCIDLSKGIITSVDSTYYVSNPTNTKFKTTNSQSDFIFGIGIVGLNLSSSIRYFDIKLQLLEFSNSVLVNQTAFPLQMCKNEQWDYYNSSQKNYQQQLDLSNYLCPNENTTVELEGRLTSKSYKSLAITIGKCNNKTDPTRPCADEVVLNSINTSIVSFFYLNSYVNSRDKQAIGQYLEDRNLLVLTLNQTTSSHLYLTEHTIETDRSLMPWSSVWIQKILVTDQLLKTSSNLRLNPNQDYVSIYISKSSYYRVSQRTYKKIQDVLSDIGGLFGTVVGVFLIFMNIFSEASFEINISGRLLHCEDDEQFVERDDFNLFHHIGCFFYSLLKKFDIDVSWRKIESFEKYRKEISEQLDVSFLINKITFLEKCMSVILEEHHIRGIYLQPKPNLEEAEKSRMKLDQNQKIYKNQGEIDQKNQEIYYQQKNNVLKGLAISNDSKNNKDIKQKKNNTFDQKEEVPFHLINIISYFTDQNSKQSEKIENKSKGSQNINKNIVKTDEKAKDGKQLKESQCYQSHLILDSAFKDIVLLQSEANQGNLISQKVYSKLDNQITKKRIIQLKSMESANPKKLVEAGKEEHLSQQLRPDLPKKEQINKAGDERTNKSHEIDMMTQDRLESEKNRNFIQDGSLKRTNIKGEDYKNKKANYYLESQNQIINEQDQQF